MSQVIDFTARLNQRRADADKAASAATADKQKQERLRNAAKTALTIGALLGKSDQERVIGAMNFVDLELDKIEQEEKEKADRWMPAYCSPDNEFRGSKYEATRDLSLKEVAKRIRQDIKNMIAAGALPKGIKVSVRMDGYNALRVNVTALPEGFKVYNPDYVRDTKNFAQPAPYGLYNYGEGGAYTPQFKAIVDALDANTNSYNRDNSDSMSDYFDVRFYDGRAGLDWRLERAIKERESVDLSGEA